MAKALILALDRHAEPDVLEAIIALSALTCAYGFMCYLTTEDDKEKYNKLKIVNDFLESDHFFILSLFVKGKKSSKPSDWWKEHNVNQKFMAGTDRIIENINCIIERQTGIRVDMLSLLENNNILSLQAPVLSVLGDCCDQRRAYFSGHIGQGYIIPGRTEGFTQAQWWQC